MVENKNRKENSKKIAHAELLGTRVVVWDEEEGNKIYSEKYFGKWVEEEKVKFLQLMLEEAMLLLERGFIEIKESGKVLDVSEFYRRCCEIDPEFPFKYIVYRDLRNRGFIVKSGFKFGTHFRVYERGVNPYKRGEKSSREHTKYNVHAVPENIDWSLADLSRFVRLSQNIRAKPLLAVVDEEGSVTYYIIKHVSP